MYKNSTDLEMIVCLYGFRLGNNFLDRRLIINKRNQDQAADKKKNKPDERLPLEDRPTS